MGIIKSDEHFLFRNYSKALKQWLIDTCYLSNYPQENNVTIVYSTPDRAWAKYIYPVINGATTSPNVNFVLNSMEYLDSENILGHVRENIFDDELNVFKTVKAPLMYSLTYSATIYTRVQSEMDILLYQLTTNASKNAKAVLKVDGQWAEVWANNIRNETNLEPGEIQDKVTRYGIDLIIPRAYLPFNVEFSNAINGFEYEIEI